MTAATLRSQLEQFQGIEADPNEEHYRAVAMRDWLAEHRAPTNAQVEAVLTVASTELDGALHGHLFHELLAHRGLTDEQFSRVAASWADRGFVPEPSISDSCRWQKSTSCMGGWAGRGGHVASTSGNETETKFGALDSLPAARGVLLARPMQQRR